MKIKEWLKEHVNFKREAEEVRDNKEYAITLGVVGLIAGAIMGIVIVILQMVLGSATSAQKTTNILSVVVILALIAYLIWLLLPMFKDPSLSISSKIATTVISLVCLAVPFIIGVYLVVLAIMAVVVVVVLWLGLKIWGSSSSSSSSEPDPDYYRQLGDD